MGGRVFIVIAMMAMVGLGSCGYRDCELVRRKVTFVIVAVLEWASAILDKTPIRYFSGFD